MRGSVAGGAGIEAIVGTLSELSGSVAGICYGASCRRDYVGAQVTGFGTVALGGAVGGAVWSTGGLVGASEGVSDGRPGSL